MFFSHDDNQIENLASYRYDKQRTIFFFYKLMLNKYDIFEFTPLRLGNYPSHSSSDAAQREFEFDLRNAKFSNFRKFRVSTS